MDNIINSIISTNKFIQQRKNSKLKHDKNIVYTYPEILKDYKLKIIDGQTMLEYSSEPFSQDSQPPILKHPKIEPVKFEPITKRRNDINFNILKPLKPLFFNINKPKQNDESPVIQNINENVFINRKTTKPHIKFPEFNRIFKDNKSKAHQSKANKNEIVKDIFFNGYNWANKNTGKILKRRESFKKNKGAPLQKMEIGEWENYNENLWGKNIKDTFDPFGKLSDIDKIPGSLKTWYDPSKYKFKNPQNTGHYISFKKFEQTDFVNTVKNINNVLNIHKIVYSKDYLRNILESTNAESFESNLSAFYDLSKNMLTEIKKKIK